MVRVTVRALPLADTRARGGVDALLKPRVDAQCQQTVLSWNTGDPNDGETKNNIWIEARTSLPDHKPLNVSSTEIQRVFNSRTALEKFKCMRCFVI